MADVPNPAKDALDKAAELLKLTLALSTGALVFSAGLAKEKLDLAGWPGMVLVVAWALLAVAAAAGILAISAIPPMLAKQNYDLEDPYLVWPARVHQISFVLGVVLLGLALAASLFRATLTSPKKPPIVSEERKVLGTIGPELIGSISNFPLGSAQLDATNELVELELQHLMERWNAGRTSGKSGLLLIVGSTDRVPLASDTRRRFDANIGLATARAEAIKVWLMDKTKDLGDLRIQQEGILTLASGPRQTPELKLGSAPKLNDGIPGDRRVDVWALWSLPSGALYVFPVPVQPAGK